MENNNRKGWLYLLPAIVFLGVFMVYPLIDVLIYSLEEGFNFASQTSFGVGGYNYSYVLHDPYFLQACGYRHRDSHQDQGVLHAGDVGVTVLGPKLANILK